MSHVDKLSRDGGRTWTEPASVTGPQQGFYWGAGPAVGRDAWYVAHPQPVLDATLHATVARVAVSRDAGATWSSYDANPSSTGLDAMQLRVVPRGEGERLALAHAAPSDDGEVPVLSTSDDGGRTWSEPFVLDENDGPGGSLQVAMDVDRAGVVHASYFHHTSEDTVERRAVAVVDGRVLGPVVLDAGLPSPSGNLGLGDYMGMAALPGGTTTVWVGESERGRDLFFAKLMAAVTG